MAIGAFYHWDIADGTATKTICSIPWQDSTRATVQDSGAGRSCSLRCVGQGIARARSVERQPDYDLDAYGGMVCNGWRSDNGGDSSTSSAGASSHPGMHTGYAAGRGGVLASLY